MDVAIVKPIEPSSEAVPFSADIPISIKDDSARWFEGWMTVDGIDWQDENVRAKLFYDAAQEYLRKNPVVLWDHDRKLPIGKIHSITVHDGTGVFVEGEILQAKHFGFESSEDGEAADLEILKKCNEVWGLLRSGVVKGLSWHGRARKQWVWSDELRKYIKQPIDILLISEVTITPIQVGPSAQVTKVNSLAKALDIAKALPLEIQEDAMNEKLLKLKEQQAAMLETLAGLDDGIALPEDITEQASAISSSLGVSQDEEMRKSLDTVIETMATQGQILNQIVNKPAQPRNQTGKKPGAQPPPSEQGGEVFEEGVEKSLDVISNTVHGYRDRGKSEEQCHATPQDVVKLIMAKSNGRIEHRNAFTISPAAQEILRENMGVE